MRPAPANCEETGGGLGDDEEILLDENLRKVKKTLTSIFLAEI